jgi:hypothetical protein
MNTKIEQLKTYALQNLMAHEIAKLLGVSKDTVKAWAIKNNIKIYNKEDWLKDRKDEIISLYKSGITINQLKEIGYGYDLIKKTIKEVNLPWRDVNIRGKERRLSEKEISKRLPEEYKCIGFENGKYLIQSPNGEIKKKSSCKLNQKSKRFDGNINKIIEALKVRNISLVQETFTGIGNPAQVTCPNGHTRSVQKLKVLIYNKHYDCPACNFTGGYSKQELDLKAWIDSIVESVKYKIPKIDPSTPGPNQEIDIYIPEKKIGIEYCGVYYHSEIFAKKLDSHMQKRLCVESHGIQLLQIFSDEWLYKQDIVKSLIKAKLGLIDNKFYARKLELKKIDEDQASVFFKQNHLMGPSYGASYLGLYNGNDLVCAVSFKKHKNGIDIARFANKLNTVVVGGLSKLLNEIVKIRSPQFIQSFVDLRYGNGNSLLGIGFILESTTLGWKWSDGKNTYNRMKCRANMDDRKLSERQHAEDLGWYKIYDAGQAKFIKHFPTILDI